MEGICRSLYNPYLFLLWFHIPLPLRLSIRLMYLFFLVRFSYLTTLRWVDSLLSITSSFIRKDDIAVCWAWCGTKEALAAHLIAGHTVPSLSVQDVIDHTYPGKQSSEAGGNIVVALDYIQHVGIREEATYPGGAFTGRKNPNVPGPREEENVHQISSWSLIGDNEAAMLAAAKKHVQSVTVPCYSGLVFLRGEGLLDLVQAQKDHDKKILRKYFEKKNLPTFHSMLLVGYGTFVPHNPLIKPINYWIMKNQWSDVWGDRGMARVIRNSSLMERHVVSRSLRHTVDNLESIYTPTVAFVGDNPNAAQSLIMENKTRAELLDYVHKREHLKDALYYMFYDPMYCRQKGIDVRKLILALEQAHANDYAKHIALVDLNADANMHRAFKLRKTEKLVFLVFKPDTVGRSVDDARRFPGRGIKFNFGEILTWLGDKLDMAPCPVGEHD